MLARWTWPDFASCFFKLQRCLCHGVNVWFVEQSAATSRVAEGMPGGHLDTIARSYELLGVFMGPESLRGSTACCDPLRRPAVEIHFRRMVVLPTLLPEAESFVVASDC